MATAILDDGVGDDPDFDKEDCEICGKPIPPSKGSSYGLYDILCDVCLRDQYAEHEQWYEYPPADSDV